MWYCALGCGPVAEHRCSPVLSSSVGFEGDEQRALGALAVAQGLFRAEAGAAWGVASVLVHSPHCAWLCILVWNMGASEWRETGERKSWQNH